MVTSRLALTASSVVLGAAAFCASAAAEQTNAPQAEKTAVKTEIVARGLANPWALQFLPDGRYLVTEKPGRLRIVSKDGKISEPISGVPRVADQGQGGLLDVVLAPDFDQSGRIFFSFSEPREDGKNGTSVARAKLMLDGESGRLEDVSVIFRQEPAFKSSFHFGSRIVINADGSLFVTLGERNFLRAEAQNPANQIGKVIRITADGAPAADNPKLPGWDAKVWSIGHRNIQGAALDPQSDKLWTIEHGAKGGDELNHPEAGKNYGWPVISYGVDYSGAKLGEGRQKVGMEQPVYYWDPSIAVSGLTFYTGDLFPSWKGNLLVGSLKGAHVQRLVMKDGEVIAHEKLAADLDERIRDVRQGPDGAVYLLTDELKGALVRVTPAS